MKIDDWKLESLKQNLPDYAERFLTKSKGKKYCCPKCGSGTKVHNTGALGIHKAKDSNTPLFTCRSCGATGNIYQLVMLNEGLDFESALKRVRELYDPSYNPYDDERTVKTVTYTNTPKPQTQTAGTGTNDKRTTFVRDFRNHYKRWQKNIDNTNYPWKRGLDAETVKRFHLGYEPEYISPTGEETIRKKNEEREKQGLQPLTLTPSPRLIIPVDAYHYTARDIRPDDEIPDWQKDYKKVQEGKEGPLFNEKAMQNPLCFFVVEGEIDAMSIEQAGGSCVALRSTGNAENFCRTLEKQDIMKTGTVIIALDNDKAGKEAGDKIEKFCKDRGFLFTRQNVSDQYKDPNDYLVADRNGFNNTVKGIVAGIRKEKMEDYLDKYSGASAVKSFMWTNGKENFTTPTGFKKLDEEFLDGGLHPGLYILGAVSSIGKTTFCLQIAESIATAGNNVMFFSLEQSREDLISKSLSRRTYEKSLAKRKNESLAKINMNILRKEKWKDWPQADFDNLVECSNDYQYTTGKNLCIIESVGDYGIDEITEDIKTYIAVFGKKPVVFIDYLQVMKPYNERMADKQNMDRTTTALKRLSRDYDIPIVAISSFNRDSYWQQVNITSFKESGSIEYSSDCLLALSPVGVVDAKTDSEKQNNREAIQKTKTAKVRNIELHILKNRNGRITDKEHKLTFDYVAMFNHFKETTFSYLSQFDNGNPSM